MDTYRSESSSSVGELCTFHRSERGSTVIVSVTGDIDAATAPAFAQALDAEIRGGPPVLIADLTAVDFLASAGMTVLVVAHEQMAASGVFAVVADGPATSRPLEVIGLSQILPLFVTVDDAVAACTCESGDSGYPQR